MSSSFDHATGGASQEIVLRPLRPDDNEPLYWTAYARGFAWLRVCRAGLPAPHDFQTRLWQDTHRQLIAESPTHGVIGLLSNFASDYRAGYCYMDAVPLFTSSGALHSAFEVAITSFVGLLFESEGFRKIYTESLSLEPSPLAHIDGACVEGRLTNHFLADGTYWDLVISSISRSDFQPPSWLTA